MSVEGGLRAFGLLVLTGLVLCGCSREPAASRNARGDATDVRMPRITVNGDDSVNAALNWQPPAVTLAPEGIADARRRAAQALEEGRLYAGPDDAIPLYLAIRRLDPEDAAARKGLDQALDRLLERGERVLKTAEDRDEDAREAAQIAAVARAIDPDDEAVLAYLSRVDEVEQLTRLNLASERALNGGRLGEQGGGALAGFREVLKWKPGQARALQGVAAVESALSSRRGCGAGGRFRWCARLAGTRGQGPQRQRIHGRRCAPAGRGDPHGAHRRPARVGRAGSANAVGLKAAREKLAEVLRIAPPGDPVAADFRQRIELATHYGLFRPGQAFTDALGNGGRGPEMVVVPHGAFRMGADDNELGAVDAEKPAHYVRFDRGFAMARNAVTVGEFRRFVQATNYRPRATRRGHSIVYDERNHQLRPPQRGGLAIRLQRGAGA